MRIIDQLSVENCVWQLRTAHCLNVVTVSLLACNSKEIYSMSRVVIAELGNFYPRIAIALLLILPIFRFAHRSIPLKKTSGLLLE